ncbi:MAG: DUF1854 domain-containing protein [Halanaerobiaceae bacterium]
MCLARKAREELVILDPRKINLHLDQKEELNLTVEGEDTYEDVSVNPAFPLSEVGRYLSFVDSDNNEIGMLKDMNELNDEAKSVLEDILERIYFMPKIIEIHNIEEEYGVTRWDVVTEKGPRSFDIRSRRRDVRPFGKKRIIIHDVDGNRYEIPDYTELDKKSQQVLRSEI